MPMEGAVGIKSGLDKVSHFIETCDRSFHEKRKPITAEISKFFIRLHINDRHLTFTRFILALLFLPAWISGFYYAALSLLTLNIILDVIDGDLARVLNTDSDVRKFLDVTVDNIVVILYPLALMWQGLISGFLGGYYIFVMTMSWWLCAVRRSTFVKSNWIFRAQANRLLFILRFVLLTLLMFAYALLGIDIFSPAVLFISVCLTLTGIYDFYKILRFVPAR
jgi:phosphatidylglycerophosphate synthase